MEIAENKPRHSRHRARIQRLLGRPQRMAETNSGFFSAVTQPTPSLFIPGSLTL